jgi:hypothetical protein
MSDNDYESGSNADSQGPSCDYSDEASLEEVSSAHSHAEPDDSDIEEYNPLHEGVNLTPLAGKPNQ